MLSDGRFGLFFAKNTVSIAELMQRVEYQDGVLVGLRSMVRSGLTAKYNWDRITDAYISLINELLARK
jgi:glycosyltransferase involved in cell wall biosynthesis